MLITGATGVLGANISPLAIREYRVYGVARGRGNSPSGLTPVCFDLRERKATLRCLNDVQPQVIVHCAAMTDVDRCEAEPGKARLLHVEASRTLARWAEAHGSSFVYISTDSVFDGRHGNYSEEDSPAPLNEYARTKLAGEVAVRLANPSALILRTNFYGWNERGKLSLAEWMLSKLQSGQTIKGFADVSFNPLFASHLAKIILELIAHGAAGTFHAGARDSCSKHEFAIQLAQMFGFHSERVIPISVDEFPFRARRPKNTTLSVEKVSHFLSTTMPTVGDGLREFEKPYANGIATPLDSSRHELHTEFHAR